MSRRLQVPGPDAISNPAWVLRAVRAGALAIEALSPAGSGRVAGVHARAVSLVLDAGPVLTLLPAGTPVHPWALVASLEAAAFATVVACAEGASVQVSAGVMSAGPLRIEFDAAVVVDLGLHHRPAERPGASLAAFVPPPPAPPGEGPFEVILGAALESFQRGGAPAELARLVGLGPGFTPAGDDALVGVLAGLDLLRDASAAASRCREALVAALPARLDGCTTRLAAQMLVAAAAGLYAEPVLHLLEALGAGAAVDTDHPAMRALASMGERSGRDTLRGLVAAFART